jgi:SAM-dependent methyltransferase
MILQKLKRVLWSESHEPSASPAHASADIGFELKFFRPRSGIAAPPYGITDSSISEIDDASLVARLIAAYRLAREEHAGCGASMWQGFFDAMQAPLDEVFCTGSLAEAARLLRDPASSNHFYGFDNLCSSLIGPQLSPSAQEGAAFECLAGLIRLAEAMGIVRVWNPEQSSANPRAQWAAEEVLSALEQHLGVRLAFPNPFPQEVGLNTSRGIASYRAVQALYQAWRIRELVRGIPRPRVLEIGAGLGRTAYYAHLLGIETYTLVDIPLSMIAQGYFLGRCLGETDVELIGETSALARPRIRFITPKSFMESNERYDLIVNADSMTELAPEVARGYLEKIGRSSPLFLSINHEVNPETMNGMLADLRSVVDTRRSLYWMRRGYVEEIVRFGPMA